MDVYFDGEFWSEYFKEYLFPQIDILVDSLNKRILPTFKDNNNEAEEFADKEFERRMMESNINIEDYAPDEFADFVIDLGVDYYLLLIGVRQSLINIFSIMLHHLFEQQQLLFLRKQILLPNEENDISLNTMKEFKKRLNIANIDVTQFSSFKTLDELRLVANTIKHGEGESETKLMSIRPDLYTHPSFKNRELDLFKGRTNVYLPMAGQDIYLSVEDIKNYSNGIKLFFNELGQEIIRHSSSQ